jgi:hypothetical protein
LTGHEPVTRVDSRKRLAYFLYIEKNRRVWNDVMKPIPVNSMKRNLIVLVALCLFILAAAAPVSASSAGGTLSATLQSAPAETRHESGTNFTGDALTTPTVVVNGGEINISGTAKGNPIAGVAIWMFNDAGFVHQSIVQPDKNGYYSLDLGTSTDWRGYHVVVQHPMQNNLFDIYIRDMTSGDAEYGWVWNRTLRVNNDTTGTRTYSVGSRIFRIVGDGSLTGDDAYKALIASFRDPGVDDVIAIVPLPAETAEATQAVTTAGIPENANGLRDRPGPGQTNTAAGSGNLLDRLVHFLSGIF